MSVAPPNLLDAYLDRIGYRGDRAPTLATLQEIQYLHVCTIPFENLDVHLGRGIRLDLAAVEQKIIHDRRGGYCFEQNALLQVVLERLGYEVIPLIGRVRWQVPAEVVTPQTHMVLMVLLKGRRYLVDGGFGSSSMTAALEIDTDTEQRTPHEPRRILCREGAYVHQMWLGDRWADVYEFTLQPVRPVDYEVANWYTSAYPQSRFVLNLIVAITGEGVRHTLVNREFTSRWMDGRVEKRELTNPGELLDTLAHPFKLYFPADTRFGPVDARWPR